MDSILYAAALSPKYLWKQIKLIDGFPPADGTDMRSIMKALSNTGDCSISLMSNNLAPSFEDYTDPSKLTDAIKREAYNQDITAYAFTYSPTWDQICAAIYKNRAVIALVDIGDGWWTGINGGSWQEKDVLPLKLGNKVGRHFITLHSYDANYIYFRNSWSDQWGRKGNGYFDRSYMPHVLEIGTALKLPVPFIFTKDLSQNMSNNDVLQLQNRLKVVPNTGFFGTITLAAVKAYQSKYGLPTTGFVGPLTRAKLNLGLN